MLRNKRPFIWIASLLLLSYLPNAQAQAQQDPIKLPSSVINIEKENTIQLQQKEMHKLKPSEFAVELMESASEAIENPTLIKRLNESHINKSPFALGARATIFMGEFALNYQADEMTPNWHYQKINTNIYDNGAGTANHQLHYTQQVHKRVHGGLTSRVPQAEDVQSMILMKAIEETGLPLTMEANIGAGTKHHQVYNVNPKKQGQLHAYVPAVVAKGTVTYGEVYLVIQGYKRKMIIKNVTTQKVGAWLPIENHLSLTFHAQP